VLEPGTVVVVLEVTLVMVERLLVVLEAPVVLLVPPYQVPAGAALVCLGKGAAEPIAVVVTIPVKVEVAAHQE
jgi:hypothetical protein